jgi:Tfp pilus assembly protein PilF
MEEDPRFSYAYTSLSSVYGQMLITPTNTADRERIRQSMQQLAREARAMQIDSETLAWLDKWDKDMSSGNAFDAEEHWRTEVARTPQDPLALNRYSRVLAGAKLYDEGRVYLERAIAVWERDGDSGSATTSRGNYATHAIAKGRFEDALQQLKLSLGAFPDSTPVLLGAVQVLAKLGRFAEAETYLVRLRETDEMWAHSAETWLGALRGDLSLGGEALEQAFAHPFMTNAQRGVVCFVIGDVECGERYWRRMEPGYGPIFWEFGPGNEVYWAPGVLTDPRYRQLVEDLGWGPTYRAHVRKMAAEMTAITGVAVTSPIPPEDVGLY